MQNVHSSYKYTACHAPRERVSWNVIPPVTDVATCVTLHVSVWVEIDYVYKNISMAMRHAPRERVSWNVTASSCNIDFWVTLHVSVWVEIYSDAL